MMVTKICTKCATEKALEDFYKRSRATDGRMSACKDCSKRDGKISYDKNKNNEKNIVTRKIKNSEKNIVSYGPTLEAFYILFEYQQGKCLICGKPSLKRRLSIDHHHVLDALRGLLCGAHNAAIGSFEDPEMIQRLVWFLQFNLSKVKIINKENPVDGYEMLDILAQKPFGPLGVENWIEDFEGWRKQKTIELDEIYRIKLEKDRERRESGRFPTGGKPKLEAFGDKKYINDWIDDPRCPVKDSSSIVKRLKAGLTPEEAISRPPRQGMRLDPDSSRLRKNSKILECFGEKKTMIQWSEDQRCQCNYRTLKERLGRGGWEIEKAITTPTKSYQLERR